MPTGELRALLEELSPPARVRRIMATPGARDHLTWKALADRGLLGGSVSDMAAVAEELGAVLACVPFLTSAVLATGALSAAGGDGAAEYLAAVATGSTVATVAFTGSDGRWGDEPTLTATPAAGGGFALDGTVSHVVDGHNADLVLAAAREPAGIRLFAVDGDAPGLTRTPLVTLDQTRPQARLEMSGVRAEALVDDGGADGPAIVERALDLAGVALAAEAVGGARRCLEMAVAHACSRVQFGRPIGSFQAVKHRLADVAVGVESARAASAAAARAADGETGDLSLLASTAKAWCSQVYLDAAEACVHVHGAMGFTWDHDAHLYLKRAKSSALLFGDPAWHRRRVARLLGL
ncbi:MAG: acyl-CoA dehydrogenase family protein [Acidimicrobiales bacterium]